MQVEEWEKQKCDPDTIGKFVKSSLSTDSVTPLLCSAYSFKMKVLIE